MKKKVADIRSFIAGDHTILREVLHPSKDPVRLPYSLAHAYLEPMHASVPHYLGSDEVYFFTEGEGIIYLNNTPVDVEKGDVILVPAGQRQYLVNTGTENLVFLCIVSPPWQAEQEWLC